MITKSRGFISLAGLFILGLLVTSLTATVVLVKNPNISLDLRNWAAESCLQLTETGCKDLAGCIWNPEKIITSTTLGACSGTDGDCIEFRTKQSCDTYSGCTWTYRKTTVPAHCSGTPTSNASPSPSPRAACGTEGDPCCARRCNSGLYCSPIDGGTCMPRVCTPAEKECSGSTSKICKGDGSGWTNSTCQFGCKPGTSSCYACKPGSVICAGDNLNTCNSEGTSFVKSACGTDKTCDANLGRCVNKSGVCMDPCDTDLDCGTNNYCYKPSGGCAVCKAKGSLCTPGAKQCSGVYLQTCNTAGTAWISANCGTPGCNSTTKACNIASPTPSPSLSPACATKPDICNASGTLNYCSNGTYYSKACPAGQTCPAGGNACVSLSASPTPSPSLSPACATKPDVCNASGTLNYCSNGTYYSKACPTGTKCPAGGNACVSLYASPTPSPSLSPACATKPDICNASGGVNYCVNGTYYSKTCATGNTCSGGACVPNSSSPTPSSLPSFLGSPIPSPNPNASLQATYNVLNKVTFGAFGNYVSAYQNISAQNPNASYLAQAFNPQGIQASAALGTIITAEGALAVTGVGALAGSGTTALSSTLYILNVGVNGYQTANECLSSGPLDSSAKKAACAQSVGSLALSLATAGASSQLTAAKNYQTYANAYGTYQEISAATMAIDAARKVSGVVALANAASGGINTVNDCKSGDVGKCLLTGTTTALIVGSNLQNIGALVNSSTLKNTAQVIINASGNTRNIIKTGQTIQKLEVFNK